MNSICLFFLRWRKVCRSRLPKRCCRKRPSSRRNIPPLVEASGNGEYAEIFEVKNADDLAEKISKLLNDKQRRKQLAEKAYIFAQENYSIEAHLKKLKTLYDKLSNNL